MSEFKQGYKTTESMVTGIWVLGAFAGSFFIIDLTRWAYMVSLVCSSYIMARAIFKRNRQIYIHNGQKTSELKYAIISLALLGYASVFNKLALENLLICSGVIVSTLNLARGYTKGLSATHTRTMIIP